MAARLLRIFTVIAVIALIGCASVGKDDRNESWACFKTQNETECQCQTTPVGGKQDFVDHCDRDSVPGAAAATEAECCKEWIVLNGKREVAYLCSCYAKDSKSCNVDYGDEIVDRCP